METPQGSFSCNAVSFERVLSILADSKRVAEMLRTKFGLKEGKAALEMLRKGRLSGELGDGVHDFLLDEIYNEAAEVLTRYGCGSFGPYPISICEYEGVFHVRALDYGDFGYFIDLDDADRYVNGTWDVRENSEDWEEEEDE